MATPHIVTVFGSSQPKEAEESYTTAYAVGSELARAGFVVCNGGYGGTMEASARGAKDAGGTTMGLTCGAVEGKKANRWIDREFHEASLTERLMKLIAMGDAYVILRGGTGTLLELAAVWEFVNKGLLPEKPIIVLGPFWHGLIQTLKDELAWEGMEDCSRYVIEASSPEICAREISRHFRNQLSTIPPPLPLTISR